MNIKEHKILIITLIALIFVSMCLYLTLCAIQKPDNSIVLRTKIIDTLTITCYNDVGITSAETKTEYGICAVSPDLIKKGLAKIGDWLLIDDEIYVVLDKTSKKLTNRVDLWTYKPDDYYKHKKLVKKIIR